MSTSEKPRDLNKDLANERENLRILREYRNALENNIEHVLDKINAIKLYACVNGVDLR